MAKSIEKALREVAPKAIVDLARSLGDAQRHAGESHPDLFVLDVDATYDLGQEFLLDLRTSHPNARAIILTATHLTAARERTAGLGAIHFLEKPFPHSDFVDLVQALLQPAGRADEEKFQGTLSELHIADIIQLKCMSGKTAGIEFTAGDGKKGRVYFESGQVIHATASGKEGMTAFNELMTWKGGTISEISPNSPKRTINIDWQVLLMEGARNLDEADAAPRRQRIEPHTRKRKVLVVDDSTMLLNFVRDILREAYYDVTTSSSAAEGLKAAKKNQPDLILLDYILPDGKGDEFVRMLANEPKTAHMRVLYMSGLGAYLRPDANPNVIGVLNKPFTSDLLTKTVETHMPKSPDESETVAAERESAAASGAEPPATTEASFMPPETAVEPATAPTQTAPPAEDEWWSAPQSASGWPEPAANAGTDFGSTSSQIDESTLPTEELTHGAYFCGDTRFFSLNWALQAIGKQKLSGALRLFWDREPVDLLAENGEIVLVTTRDADAYCADSPITLTNVDQTRIDAARAQQRETGQPMFLTLAQEELILREPAVQLVQHYGQKLFAQLWTAPRVRFMFETATLPDYARSLPREGDIDNWALATLRSVQLNDLGNQADYDASSIPAYTKDGFERVQNLKLTVAEAQFASQFNGARSIQQIAKNLRLDFKFARLTLFRFLALEIVECWPPSAETKTERKGLLKRFGFGE